MIHDFVITARHLAFLLPPFKVDPTRIAAGKSIGESYVWQPEKGVRVLAAEKDDWSRRRVQEIEFPSVETTFGYDTIQCRNLESGKVDRYHYGPDFILNEHLLVPDLSDQTEGSGGIIGTALDLGRQATVLSIFDAQALRTGFVVQAYLPYAMPFGVHGHFVPT